MAYKQKIKGSANGILLPLYLSFSQMINLTYAPCNDIKNSWHGKILGIGIVLCLKP